MDKYDTFQTLGGARTAYARPPVAPYGTRGRPTAFRADPAFLAVLEAAMSDIWRRCPWGQAEVVTSAGCLVDKAGMHGTGRGFDFDAIFWHKAQDGKPGHEFITARYADCLPFYLGIEAVLRMHFGLVLDFQYDPRHFDHFHIDNSQPVGFHSKQRSDGLFVQAVCAYVLGIGVKGGIDGRVGPYTWAALRESLRRLGIAGDPEALALDVRAWRNWLAKVAEEAFVVS